MQITTELHGNTWYSACFFMREGQITILTYEHEYYSDIPNEHQEAMYSIAAKQEFIKIYPEIEYLPDYIAYDTVVEKVKHDMQREKQR